MTIINLSNHKKNILSLHKNVISERKKEYEFNNELEVAKMLSLEDKLAFYRDVQNEFDKSILMNNYPSNITWQLSKYLRGQYDEILDRYPIQVFMRQRKELVHQAVIFMSDLYNNGQRTF